MALDKGMARAGLVDGEVWVLLRDELAIAGEERLGGGKEAEGCPGVLDVGPQPASGDRDRGVLASLENTIGHVRLHAEPELRMGAGALGEVPAQAVPAALIA